MLFLSFLFLKLIGGAAIPWWVVLAPLMADALWILLVLVIVCYGFTEPR